MTDHDHRDSDVLGKYTAPAAPVQGEEVVQGTSEIASTSVRSPHTEIASSPWQPIETAPRNKFILLYCPEDNSRWLAKWQGDGWFGVDAEYGLTREGMGPDDVTGWEVTHWMPLPAPPRTQVGDNLTGASTSDDGNCPIELSAAYQRIDELETALRDARAFMEGVMQERGDSGVSILIKAADEALEPFPAESGAHSA